MVGEATLGALTDSPDGGITPVSVDGHSLIVARRGAEIPVAVDRYPHLGFSVTRGRGGLRFTDDVVQCPWHNSRFNVCTGENLDWVTGFAGRAVPGW